MNNNRKITQKQFARMTPAEKVAAYFNHEFNLKQGKGNSRGPSIECQGKFWNDWSRAFFDFAQNLPA